MDKRERGHESRSNARKDAKKFNASSPALQILTACRKEAAVPKTTHVMNWQQLCCSALLFLPGSLSQGCIVLGGGYNIKNIPCAGSSAEK